MSKRETSPLKAYAKLCRKFGLFLFVCSVSLLPTGVFAATTHHYTCDDFISGINPPSCSANVFTFAGDSGYRDSPAAVFNLTAGTWYLNFTYSGTGNFNVNGFATGDADHTGSEIDYVVTTLFFTRIEIWDHTSFVGTISNVCVTDTPGDCASGGGGGGSGNGVFPDGSEVFPGIATTTIVFSIVDNPTQDFFNGMVLFLMCNFGLIWVFKSRRQNL